MKLPLTCRHCLPVFLTVACLVPSLAWAQSAARGIVYHDVNQNRKLDDSDARLSGIAVSNGLDIVTTDDEGQYELSLTDDDIIFLIKPRGWHTLLDEDNLPQFYYIHKPAGSPRLRYAGVEPTGVLPRSIDFPLYPQEEPDRFQTILFGDTQSRDAREVDYMNRTVIPELTGSDAAFGVTLGDIMFDDLSLFPYHNRSVAMIGVPWYNVLGNHDLNMDTSERRFCNETFERWYGPTYYSFDYGNVHFVVLDNIDWHLPENEIESTYEGRFGEEQLEFVKNDLARIPDNQFVVLFMHIPLNDCDDAAQLYRLIESRPLCFSVSAHRHQHQHRFLGEADGWRGKQPHHHIVNVTVCGSWWSGQKDELGIPHSMMADGAPRGYTILTFDGDDYELDFKAAGLPADQQMRIMLPGDTDADSAGQPKVYVNVYNGSQRSTVEMRIAGVSDWSPLARVWQVDPAYAAAFAREQSVTPPIEPALIKPKESTHLWSAASPELEPGTWLVEVRTTDMHGRSWQAQRVLRVQDDRE